MPDDTSTHPSRRKLRWAGGLTALALAVAVGAEAHGRASRVLFEGAPAGQGRMAMVTDAAAAYGVWETTGIHGRRLVVLTGQWSKPMGPRAGPGEPGGAGGDPGAIDARNALLQAGKVGIARAFDVVMVPQAFSQRLGEARGRKELEQGDGTFELHYIGLPRRFSTPRAFVAPAETALVLVEPTWFSGAAPDPVAFLAERGVRWDLLLVALGDPVASEPERLAALAFCQRHGIPFWEVTP